MGFLDRFRRATALTPNAAAAGTADGSLVLIDVREPGEFRAGHAPGARNVPLAQVGASLESLQAESATVAFICRSGMRSASAASTARRAGLAAQNVKGGMLAWERVGLPTESGVSPGSAARSRQRSRRGGAPR